MRSPSALTVLVAGSCAAALGAQKPDSVATPGLEWARDLAAAQAAAKEDGKPVLAYFTFET
jgi:hypothetical protein